jgi:transcriptional regulator with XRE-family HTH domain
MGTRAVEKGAIAAAVAENVEAVRKRRGLTQQQLASELARLGRPMQASAVAKVESGDRRVDADDLAAFAVALNVPVARLMLPDGDEDQPVFVVPAFSVPAYSAWDWATGERSLWKQDDDGQDPAVQERDMSFIAERPLWKRLQDEQDLAKAARHVAWVVGKVLSSRTQHKTPKTRAAAALGWLSRLEGALEDVKRSAQRVADEVADRG